MFYLSRSLFVREVYKTSFLAAVRDINLEKPKNIASTNHYLFVFDHWPTGCDLL